MTRYFLGVDDFDPDQMAPEQSHLDDCLPGPYLEYYEPFEKDEPKDEPKEVEGFKQDYDFVLDLDLTNHTMLDIKVE